MVSGERGRGSELLVAEGELARSVALLKREG